MPLQDDTLVHQVRIVFSYGVLSVSCNCRARTPNNEYAGKVYYEAIGPAPDFEAVVELFNDPASHWAPFTEGDKLREH